MTAGARGSGGGRSQSLDWDRQLVDGYSQTPQATRDEWGDLGDAALAGSKLVHAMLDAEETGMGLEW